MSVNIWNVYGAEEEGPEKHPLTRIPNLDLLPITQSSGADDRDYLRGLFRKMWVGEPEGYIAAINAILPLGTQVTAHQYCGLILLAEYFRTPALALTNFSSAKARLIETDDILYDVATALSLTFIDDEVVTIQEADAHYYAATGKRTRRLYATKEGDDGSDKEGDTKRRALT